MERICNCKGSEEAYIVLRDTLTSQHQSIVVCITNPGISASFGVQNFYWGFFIYIVRDFPVGSDGKSICLQCRRSGFNPWVGKIPWRRKWQPTPVFLPEKSHGQRSLAGYSPWGLKESDMTERLHLTIYIVNLYIYESESEVAQLCPTLCNPMDGSLHQAPPSMGFSRQEYWSGLAFPSPGNLTNPGIEPRSLTL